MKIIRIPKGKGRWRTIYAPSEDEKRVLLELLPTLNAAARKADSSNVAHGFREGRSPLTNAKPHIGHRFTLTMDLQDFFDSVTPDHVPDFYRYNQCFLKDDGSSVSVEDTIGKTGQKPFIKVSAAGITIIAADGVCARQGLPTSPALANLAAAPMDAKILALRARRGRFHMDFVYTRYADDMAFSYDEERIGTMLKATIPEIVESFGFKLNDRKTKLQSAKCGRRIITGIAVSDTGVHAPRHMRRRLRAARHQRNTAEARGLAEWLRLQMPKAFLSSLVPKPPTARAVSQPGAAAKPKTSTAAPAPTRGRRFELD